MKILISILILVIVFGFDIFKFFSFSVGSWFGKNITKFVVDNNSYVQIDNKKKDILIIAKGPTDW